MVKDGRDTAETGWRFSNEAWALTKRRWNKERTGTAFPTLNWCCGGVLDGACLRFAVGLPGNSGKVSWILTVCVQKSCLKSKRSLRITLRPRVLWKPQTIETTLQDQQSLACCSLTRHDHFPARGLLSAPPWPRWTQPRKARRDGPPRWRRSEERSGVRESRYGAQLWPLLTPFSSGNDAVLPARSCDTSRLTGACSCEGRRHEAGTAIRCIPSHQGPTQPNTQDGSGGGVEGWGGSSGPWGLIHTAHMLTAHFL